MFDDRPDEQGWGYVRTSTMVAIQTMTDNHNKLLYQKDRAIAALHLQKLKNVAGVGGISDLFAVVTKLAAAEPGSRA
jgi:hypothetical protein